MGSCCSSSSAKSSDTKSSSTPASPSKKVAVPEDISELLVKAINDHSAETPAFDAIKANFLSTSAYSIDSNLASKPPVLTLACKDTLDDLIVFLLSEMHADPNPPNFGTFGKPALVELMSDARPAKCLTAARALVRAGADPNLTGFGGITAYTKVIDTFTGPTVREMLMVLATKDGTITDMSTIPVPTSNLQNESWYTKNVAEGKIFVHAANPLHYAVAKENSIAALVMLELGVSPSAKTESSKPKSPQDLIDEFIKGDRALYDTIQAVIDDPANAKRATEIYDGLVATAAAAE